MSTRKSVQQLVRESVRRILSEAPAPAEPALKVKVFGTSASPTSLRDTVVEKWGEYEEGAFKFTFTPSADKKTGAATVEAVGGAREDAL